MLFRSYSFKGLVELITNKIGFSSLIVLFGAYLGVIVYFCAIPSKGRFSTDFARTNAGGFFQQAFYALSLVTLLMPFISGWSSFFIVIVFYGILAAPLFLNVHIFRREFTFADYLRFKGGPKSMLSEYRGIALSWVAILAELFAFFYFDPTIPLVGWAIILYTLAAAFLLSAFTQSVLFNASSCAYGKITTTDGIVEGFIVAKGEDNYVVKTKDSELLLSSDYVKSISSASLPPASEAK